MSDNENKPKNNLPQNENKNPSEKEAQEKTGGTQPAEDVVEQPSEDEKNFEDRDIGDALVEENSATEKRESEKDLSSEADMEEDRSFSEKEKVTSKEEKPTAPGPEKRKSPEKISEDRKDSDDKDMGEFYVEEAEANKNRPSQKNISPEAEIDEDKEDSNDRERDSSRPTNAQSAFEDSVAEEREDESAGERHGILKKDYHSMSKEALVEELEKLVKNEKVQAIKEHVDEIRAEFNAKFDEEVEQKKEEFLADGGNIIDFHYSTPLKKRFNSVYFDYKEKRNKYYQQLKQDLNKNLDKRVEIIEELKGLIDVEENINTTYNHFKELQERWRNAGAIPRDKYNTVWNTYHHHVENFYDFLHLNREFRDLDFKHNLEQKLKIINRAEELTQEKDTNRAFRELQMLHRMWKEDLGPVEKEYREDIWQKFSEATKKIHDKRQEYFAEQEKEYEKNLKKKEEIIEKIREIAETNYSSHKQWQQKIKEVEALREEFFNAGKVPRAVNDKTWKKFKETVRNFNRNKNAFYKDQKKEQYENLRKKQELVKIAEDNKDSEDFKATTALMKKIQSDWKKIGHVPRKDSDKIWKRFKSACNHYFDRLHTSRNEENKEETEAFEKKKGVLDSLKNMEFSGERKKDLPVIKNYIEEWKNLGKVPHSKRYIEGKFNKALDQAFEQLDMDKTQTELLKYENKVQALEDADDDRKINNEHYFLTKKVEETKAEIRQLENNLQFFSNVNENNPLVKEVHENIRKHKEQLEIWKEKLQKIKSLY